MQRRLLGLEGLVLAIIGTGCGATMSQSIPRASHDYALQERVAQVGARLLAAAGHADSATWHFSVYDDPQLGAVVSESGSIAVEAGLARRLFNDELAAVIAHEASHVLLAHANRRFMAWFLTQLAVSGTTVGLSVATDMPVWAGILTFFGLEIASIYPNAGYARSLESDADEYGLRLLCGAGFPSDAMTRMLEKVQAYFADVPGMGEGTSALASHPETALRIARIQSLAPQYCTR
ncbi:MAG: M48 family metalloprotease [bacterium]|nr:M48 family metalloprotease [bacterium]